MRISDWSSDVCSSDLTVLLPHTLAYNSSAVPDAMRRIAAAASVADAPQGLFDLQRKLGAPQSLEALGMPFDGIAEAARLATENAYRNPREITSAGIEKLLSRAFAGNRPLRWAERRAGKECVSTGRSRWTPYH